MIVFLKQIVLLSEVEMRSLFLGAPAIGGTRRRSGTSLLRKLMPRARERVALMPVAEQSAELAEAFGMVIRDHF